MRVWRRRFLCRIACASANAGWRDLFAECGTLKFRRLSAMRHASRHDGAPADHGGQNSACAWACRPLSVWSGVLSAPGGANAVLSGSGGAVPGGEPWLVAPLIRLFRYHKHGSRRMERASRRAELPLSIALALSSTRGGWYAWLAAVSPTFTSSSSSSCLLSKEQTFLSHFLGGNAAPRMPSLACLSRRRDDICFGNGGRLREGAAAGYLTPSSN